MLSSDQFIKEIGKDKRLLVLGSLKSLFKLCFKEVNLMDFW